MNNSNKRGRPYKPNPPPPRKPESQEINKATPEANNIQSLKDKLKSGIKNQSAKPVPSTSQPPRPQTVNTPETTVDQSALKNKLKEAALKKKPAPPSSADQKAIQNPPPKPETTPSQEPNIKNRTIFLNSGANNTPKPSITNRIVPLNPAKNLVITGLNPNKKANIQTGNASRSQTPQPVAPELVQQKVSPFKSDTTQVEAKNGTNPKTVSKTTPTKPQIAQATTAEPTRQKTTPSKQETTKMQTEVAPKSIEKPALSTPQTQVESSHSVEKKPEVVKPVIKKSEIEQPKPEDKEIKQAQEPSSQVPVQTVQELEKIAKVPALPKSEEVESEPVKQMQGQNQQEKEEVPAKTEKMEVVEEPKPSETPSVVTEGLPKETTEKVEVEQAKDNVNLDKMEVEQPQKIDGNIQEGGEIQETVLPDHQNSIVSSQSKETTDDSKKSLNSYPSNIAVEKDSTEALANAESPKGQVKANEVEYNKRSSEEFLQEKEKEKSQKDEEDDEDEDDEEEESKDKKQEKDDNVGLEDLDQGAKKVKTAEGSPDDLSGNSPKSRKSHHTEKSSKGSVISKARVKAQQKQAEKIKAAMMELEELVNKTELAVPARVKGIINYAQNVNKKSSLRARLSRVVNFFENFQSA